MTKRKRHPWAHPGHDTRETSKSRGERAADGIIIERIVSRRAASIATKGRLGTGGKH